MSLVMAGFVPHPPIIVPEVGGAEVQKVAETCRSMEQLGEKLVAARPEAAVVISPHAPMGRQAVPVAGTGSLRGSLARFGAPEVQVQLDTDEQLLRLLESRCHEEGVPVDPADGGRGGSWSLDHGVVVPWYYLQQAGLEVPVVAVGLASLPAENFLRLGRAIARAAEDSGRRVILVASGDLSHRLKPGAPAGYSPRGEEFDRRVVEAVRNWSPEDLANLEPSLLDEAGECGWRPLLAVAGAFWDAPVSTRVFSYEGPFGVGYMVAAVAAAGEGEDRNRSQACIRQSQNQVDHAGQTYLSLARQALETYAREEKALDPPRPLPPELDRQAACFVSLKKDGDLRGCIGTLSATRENLAREIIANAIGAGFRDPRFSPLQADEIAQLHVSVDVLGEPEPVEGVEDLDPKNYGVLVRSGARSGVLLPDLEGVDLPEQQLQIAARKAGIGPHDSLEIYRFQVERYAE